MQKITKYILAVLALLSVASCKKDAVQYNLQPGQFQTGNALTSTSAAIVLTQATENDTAVTFQWKAASFGNGAVVSYTFQLAAPKDTANDWANAKFYTVSGLQYAFVGKDLNNLLNSMGLTPGAASTLVARVKATVNQYNGTASTVPPVYTNTLSLQVTSYALDMYIPGDYQNWDPASAPKLGAVNGKAGLYEGYVYMAAPGQHYFKFTNAPDWNHTNYGDGGNGTFSTDGNAAGLSVPDGGYYYLTADLNKNVWTATRVTWGIIGDATPGGWDNDTQLQYDATAQVWTVQAAMKKNGSFKFRANNEWKIDFGIDNTGKLAYADNPFLGYTDGLSNLSVTEDGNYTITLDLHTGGKYTYSLRKN
ncbi:SusE domain-containing protein [Deminuibacter soli]|uniref:SusF/SusE family outer membrane protein n=1 Tax=Deminuibacter soli TaxID=2291815 RepID=A0A3E1NGT5_9BACT|nr:SusE domain-containing protein [Deminuibacter soli]RFM27061.1 SusF/SusE family outer membrane protein [Deminuibacter soli]